MTGVSPGRGDNQVTRLLEEGQALVDRHGLDLLQQMLAFDPATRISAKAALRHPYFRELDEAHRSAGESLADHPFAIAAITGAWAGGGRDELLDQNSGSGGNMDGGDGGVGHVG